MNPIDVRDLIDHPGTSRTVHIAEAVAGLRLELAAVPEDVPIRADLLLESVVEGILVSGPVSGRASLSCARCLKSFDDGFDVRVRELFSREAGPGDDEYPLSPSGEIDIESMVRDAILLSMPFSPLCRPDCRGLCERCGGDRNLEDCTCTSEPADPRWAALDGLF
jgi:uncharacterized protein